MFKGFFPFLERMRIGLSIAEFFLSILFLLGTGVAGYSVLNPISPFSNIWTLIVWIPLLAFLILAIKSPFKSGHHPMARWLFAVGVIVMAVLLGVFGVVYHVTTSKPGDIWTALAWGQLLFAFFVMICNILTKWEPLKRISALGDFLSTFFVVLHSGALLVTFNNPFAKAGPEWTTLLGWLLFGIGAFFLIMLLFQKHHAEARIGGVILFLLVTIGFFALHGVTVFRGFDWSEIVNLTTGSLSLFVALLIILFSALLPIPEGTTPLEAAEAEGESS